MISWLRNLPYRLKKLWIYGRFILFEDYDWDWVFLLQIMKIKMGLMRKCFLENNIVSSTPRIAQQLFSCECMIDRILGERYHEKDWDKFWNKWGKITYLPAKTVNGRKAYTVSRKNIKTDKDREQEQKEFRDLWERQENSMRQDLRYLFSTMEKYLRHWWD